MSQHPALQSGNVAVITGAADGIGLAVARRLDALGLRLVLADIDGAKLEQAAAGLGEVVTAVTDVTSLPDLQALQNKASASYGRVDVLMNNAGTVDHCSSWENYEAWQRVLNTNLWGVINGVHAFLPAMLEQGTPGLIINTGSKQGITCPPGNPAYNVSKAGVKAVTEALQHQLRNTEGSQLDAHLLVPGFVYSGMVRRWLPEKPDGAWTCEQTADFMLESLERGDFYILCPDNDVTREMDNKRIAWAMGDLVENRPPLSRWHPDYEAAFERYMQE